MRALIRAAAVAALGALVACGQARSTPLFTIDGAAMTAMKRGDWDEAIALLETFAFMDPTDPAPNAGLVYAYGRRGEDKKELEAGSGDYLLREFDATRGDAEAMTRLAARARRRGCEPCAQVIERERDRPRTSPRP